MNSLAVVRCARLLTPFNMLLILVEFPSALECGYEKETSLNRKDKHKLKDASLSIGSLSFP